MKSVTAQLTYPVLALFLSIAWTQSDIRIRQLGKYIREHIEGRLGNIGWEHFHTGQPDLGKIGSLAHFASIGILSGTPCLTVLVSLLTPKFSTIDKVLLCLDVLVILLTIFLFIFLLVQHKPKLIGKGI